MEAKPWLHKQRPRRRKTEQCIGKEGSPVLPEYAPNIETDSARTAKRCMQHDKPNSVSLSEEKTCSKHRETARSNAEETLYHLGKTHHPIRDGSTRSLTRMSTRHCQKETRMAFEIRRIPWMGWLHLRQCEANPPSCSLMRPYTCPKEVLYQPRPDRVSRRMPVVLK